MLIKYYNRYTLSSALHVAAFISNSGMMSGGHRYSTRTNTDAAKKIYEAALGSVQPFQMVTNNLHLQNGRILKVGTSSQPLTIDLEGKNCHVVAFGKAVVGMVAAIDSILGDKIVSGIASIPTNIQSELVANGGRNLLPSPSSAVKLCEGAYMNIPDNACLQTSAEIQKLVTKLTDRDLLITLISGGGSALLCLPLPPISLEDLADTTRSLAKAGASIVELNTVRKHIEVLKGGGLASLAQPAQVVSLLLSDIVGDPIDCIASGPTVADTSTSADALEIIERYLPEQQICASVMEVLRNDIKSSAVRHHHEGSKHAEAHNTIIGSNSIALQSAVEKRKELSVLPVLVTSELCGEAAQVGRDMAELARRVLEKRDNTSYMQGLFTETAIFSPRVEEGVVEAVRQARRDGIPLCMLFGGETTVEVKGSGKGGRNQEMCLSAMISMSKLNLPDDRVVFTSVGTDGQDGPTDAAGARITPQCMLGSPLDAQTYLDSNDSFSYFSQLMDGVCLERTGLTGTNVMDISLLLISP